MLIRLPGEPATWGTDRGHSFARVGIATPVAIGPTDVAEMGSRVGDAVECPLDDGVATGCISGDCTEDDEVPDAKPFALLFLCGISRAIYVNGGHGE